MEVLNEGMILAWRFEEGERLNHVDNWMRTALNKGNSHCKSPEIGNMSLCMVGKQPEDQCS